VTEHTIKAALDGKFYSLTETGIKEQDVDPDFIPYQVDPQPRRTAPRRAWNPWSDAETECLLKLRAQGVTHQRIAKEMGKSIDSISSRIRLLRETGKA
jgi:DNA-directed RNA polymerase specialized sigma24 family protein